MEHRESRADLVREREEIELSAEMAVVALARLLEPQHVGVEVILREPRGAVHALQLLIARIAAPVHAGNAQHPDRAQPSRVRHMGAAAEVDEGTGPVDADSAHVGRQPVDDVDLEV